MCEYPDRTVLWVEGSCARQDLPLHVTDVAVLQRVAAILRTSEASDAGSIATGVPGRGRACLHAIRKRVRKPIREGATDGAGSPRQPV